MSQQDSKYEPKSSLYEQIKSLDGVTKVQMRVLATRGIGVYIEGGDDEEISEAFAIHTYEHSVKLFVGDTEYRREFFIAKWYRDYDKFIKDFELGAGV